MYKSRIKKWGLDKSNKENEMRAMVRKMKERQNRNKPSTFRVRGRTINYLELVRYYARKHMTIEDVIAQGRSSPTPEAVECHTPLLSPIATPSNMAIPEQILLTIREYVDGSFEAGTWIQSEPRYHCSSVKENPSKVCYLKDFAAQSIVACNLFKAGLFQEAGRTLIIATAEVKSFLLEESPLLLHDVFALLIDICSMGRSEIASAILRTLSDFSSVLMGENHPLRRVYGGLVLLECDETEQVAVEGLKSIAAHFERHLGPMHKSTLLARMNCMNLVNHYHEGNSSYNLLRECDQKLGPRDVRTAEIRLNYSRYLYRQEKYHESCRVCQIVLEHVSLLDRDVVFYQSWTLQSLAFSQHALQDRLLAEGNLREAIRLRMSTFGPEDGWARHMLVLLEAWLYGWGQMDAAQDIRAWRQNILYSLDIE